MEARLFCENVSRTLTFRQQIQGLVIYKLFFPFKLNVLIARGKNITFTFYFYIYNKHYDNPQYSIIKDVNIFIEFNKFINT